MIQLPIDPFVDGIVDQVRARRAVVVVAAPGAGKTTRVPPALSADGAVVLLQPRRAAARAIAARIAEERGWAAGREVGWQVRFERRFGPGTRLLVATEGVLTSRLQQDPLLSAFRTIVLDEFHERSVHADLALALARQAWRARPDLRIVIMSATLDAGQVAAFLDGCPIVDIPGRLFPLDVGYRPGQSMADEVEEVLGETSGQVLCFLSGAAEIRRTMGELERRLAAGPAGGVSIVPLHGTLDAREQDEALAATDRRRVIVATNLAETSVTVPGVTAVVDSGFHKVARYDAERAIDTLDVERITQDAADQRAGRAGRTSPGIVRRLWDGRIRLRPHREPEIRRVDLCGVALDIIGWGGDPRHFEWFEPPREHALASALALLERLELVRDGALTSVGRLAIRIPLHPRLARMLIAGGGAPPVARACALISERGYLPPRTSATTSDLLSALDDWARTPPHVKRAADAIEQIARGMGDALPAREELRRVVLAGYPDRVARRRAAGSRELLLASGAGATLATGSGVVEGEFLVAVDISSSKVRIASLVEREWLAPTTTDVVHRFDRASGSVKAIEIDRYGALPIAERGIAADAEIAARMLADVWLARGPSDADRTLLRRMAFSGRDVDLPALAARAAAGARSIDDVQIGAAVEPDVRRALEREAPVSLLVPSGRQVPLVYGDDGSVSASVKLQEMFGLAETPRVGMRREPVLLVLLAPNGRPVQTTRDLRSFWDRGYAQVRRELRGRYPKHPWPEDPWHAQPTARAARRRR
ncbi:MAG: ATP-dependent helicase HrpB [Acidobacteria bacterium]|nr:ATP-dependent helicase HrpB [Acidobacteriota bacterium]